MNVVVRAASPRAPLDVRVACALAVVYVVWGSTYLAMRVAVAALPPWGMAGSRFVVAGLVALGLARLRNEELPRKRDWLLALPTGSLLFVVGNGLVAVAEQSCHRLALLSSGVFLLAGLLLMITVNEKKALRSAHEAQPSSPISGSN